MTNKPKRSYNKLGKQTSGIKSTYNLFMDGFSWRKVNRRCDAFMAKCGIPKEKTPTFIE